MHNIKNSKTINEMKTVKLFKNISFAAIITLVLAACEHSVKTKTQVHEDGSIDKMIVLSEKGAEGIKKNYFNIGEGTGWSISVDSVKMRQPDDSTLKTKYSYTFQKSFRSVADANAELATPNDSLFRISSQFKKQFRWFYTHYAYSETYHQLNRFALPITDYLTEADRQFIRQLPAEGGKISRADSLFLKKLNERIFDEYGPRACFEEFFASLLRFSDNRYAENLNKNKENIFQGFKSDQSGFNFFSDNNNGKSFDIISPKMADSLGIDRNSKAYKASMQLLESKIDFAGWAQHGAFQHCTELDGELVKHNADSVSGNRYYWSPPYLKFAFEDYTMQVTTRKPNLWAWGITVLVLGATAWQLVRKKTY